MTDPTAPLFKVDRDMIGMIVENYLGKHLEIEERFAGLFDDNPHRIDRKGLEQSLIQYCAMLRRGEVPEK